MVVIRAAAAARPHSVSVYPAWTGQASPLAAHPVSKLSIFALDRKDPTLDVCTECPSGWAVLAPLSPHRMTVLAWLALFLSWGSLGLETATVVVSRSIKTGKNGKDGRDCEWKAAVERKWLRRPDPWWQACEISAFYFYFFCALMWKSQLHKECYTHGRIPRQQENGSEIKDSMSVCTPF